jgi:hypothetical protein
VATETPPHDVTTSRQGSCRGERGPFFMVPLWAPQRLTGSVTDQVQVSEEVRKEQIETEGDRDR